MCSIIVKGLNMSIKQIKDDLSCPDCHKPLVLNSKDNVYECPDCGFFRDTNVILNISTNKNDD